LFIEDREREREREREKKISNLRVEALLFSELVDVTLRI
jgi:hypothetical protein